MSDSNIICVAALYHFSPVVDVAGWRNKLQLLCNQVQTKGTILIAPEGINGTIAGSRDAIDQILAHIRSTDGFAGLDVKFSYAETMPFYRMKVREKREIVTMGQPNIDPTKEVGHYVDAHAWNELIADPNVILIDTRNDYEVAIGTFEGAVDPKTKTFREFPEWFRANKDMLTKGADQPKFAMFCTGGIRCEKSTAFLKSEGVDEVYHLRGGILRYLEEIPENQSRWQGECFVFDERVSVKHGLEIGSMELCHACRNPIDAAAKAHPAFSEGISCPSCINDRDDAARVRYAERQLQIKLAKKRGEKHIGAPPRRHD